jgi:hypothetical protein
MEAKDIWGMDPVHPKLLVYAKTATGVVKFINNLAETEGKRRRTDSLEGEGMSDKTARRGRHDPSLRGEW